MCSSTYSKFRNIFWSDFFLLFFLFFLCVFLFFFVLFFCCYSLTNVLRLLQIHIFLYSNFTFSKLCVVFLSILEENHNDAYQRLYISSVKINLIFMFLLLVALIDFIWYILISTMYINMYLWSDCVTNICKYDKLIFVVKTSFFF